MNGHKLRAKDYRAVTNILLLRLAPADFNNEQKTDMVAEIRKHAREEEVPWGSSARLAKDLLGLINAKRKRDGMSEMTNKELKEALLCLKNRTMKDPAAEEVLDALNNAREMRLGLNRFESYALPPDDIQKSA